jgi:hypothetical protein
VVYVYAITEPQAEVPDAPGFEGAPLRMVRAGSVAAIASDLDERVEPSESTLWEHERVVEELMGSRALLPMRFGSTLADETALEAMLGDREEELVRGLARVQGAVELGVRALWEAEDEPGADADAPAPPAAGAGTTYLLRRLGRSRRSEELADAVHAPLDLLARESRRRVLSVPRIVVTGAYLIDEHRVDEFRATAEELDERIAEAAILCTGPWPPYSFAPGEAIR